MSKTTSKKPTRSKKPPRSPATAEMMTLFAEIRAQDETLYQELVGAMRARHVRSRPRPPKRSRDRALYDRIAAKVTPMDRTNALNIFGEPTGPRRLKAIPKRVRMKAARPIATSSRSRTATKPARKAA